MVQRSVQKMLCEMVGRMLQEMIWGLVWEVILVNGLGIGFRNWLKQSLCIVLERFGQGLGKGSIKGMTVLDENSISF